MTSMFLRVFLLLTLIPLTSLAEDGGSDKAYLSIYVFSKGIPQKDVALEIDGEPVSHSNEDGAIKVQLPAGSYQAAIAFSKDEKERLILTLEKQEQMQILVYRSSDQSPALMDIESSHKKSHDVSLSHLMVNEAFDAEEKQAVGSGVIQGKVRSLESDVPVVGAKIYISGIAEALITDEDGDFMREVPAGQYSVSVVHPDFSSQTLREIGVVADGIVNQTVLLTPSGVELEEFEVVAPYLEGSFSALVDEQKDSSGVAEVLGAEQISKSGDSNAASALKRVTGLTLVDGKFIYVRGLGERYSNITFNGSSLPSPDPTRRVVPLDVFPASVIGSVLVQKTYSPDLPGDFAGGAIVLRSKVVPEDKKNTLSLSLGGNSASTFQQGMDYEGGSRDFLGVDDGTRALPDAVDRLTQGGTVSLDQLSDAQRQELGRAFANNYQVSKKTLNPDVGLKLNMADKIQEYEGDSAWGWNFSLGYSRKERQREEDRYGYTLASRNQLVQGSTLHRSLTETDVDINSMLSFVYETEDGTSLESNTLLSRKTTDSIVFDDKFLAENDLYLQDTTLEWVERQLFSQQFTGEHVLWDFHDLKINWQTTYATAARDEPDRRFYSYYRNGNGVYVMLPKGDNNSRRYSELADELYDASIDFQLPVYDLTPGLTTFKAGVSMADKKRDSQSQRYQFDSLWLTTPSALSQDVLAFSNPEDIFAPENIRPDGWFLIDSSSVTDDYTARQRITSAYLMADMNFSPAHKMMVGARQEKFSQTLYSSALDGSAESSPLKKDSVLPAVSYTWSPSDKTQYRMAYSQTLNRPDFRERSVSPYVDPVSRDPFIGNPDLKVASISNFDLRWEHYVTRFEVYSIALFYKELTNPIEVQALSGASTLYTFVNSEKATNMGVELQGRLWLSKLLGRAFSRFYLDGNVSLIDSTVQLGEREGTSTLQGQAPWVVNMTLGYENLITSSKASLLLNMNGETLMGRGIADTPDQYLQSVPQLDFVYSYDFPYFEDREDDLSMKLSIQNILDPVYKTTYENGEVIKEYQKGSSYSIALKYKWI